LLLINWRIYLIHIIIPQINIKSAHIICFKLYSSFQKILKIIKAKKLCKSNNIEAICGEEYFIHKKYNNHPIPKNNADISVGNNNSLFLYCKYNFSLKNIINQNNIEILIQKTTNHKTGNDFNQK